MNREELRDRILQELDWDAGADASRLEIAVENGKVTLTGTVESFPEKASIISAVMRVKGVRELSYEVVVRPGRPVPDVELRRRAKDVLAWDVRIPQDGIDVTVANGWVTLSGKVARAQLRTYASRLVSTLAGVTGVTNSIRVDEQLTAPALKDEIEAAFERNARLEASRLRVSLAGRTVVLDGFVETLYERQLAEETAWAAPGVTEVDNRIEVAGISDWLTRAEAASH